MSTIKASCHFCGDVELTSEQVRLVVCTVESWSYYAFVCPQCGNTITKPANNDVIRLLRSGGVASESWTIPAEALEEHTGELFTPDDVLDFALQLYGDSDLIAAIAGRRG